MISRPSPGGRAEFRSSSATPLGWVFGFLIGFALLNGTDDCPGQLVVNGVGIWGTNVPVGWAFDNRQLRLVGIGIGHAGTLISANLILFRQQWRMSISRSWPKR